MYALHVRQGTPLFPAPASEQARLDGFGARGAPLGGGIVIACVVVVENASEFRCPRDANLRGVRPRPELELVSRRVRVAVVQQQNENAVGSRRRVGQTAILVHVHEVEKKDVFPFVRRERFRFVFVVAKGKREPKHGVVATFNRVRGVCLFFRGRLAEGHQRRRLGSRFREPHQRLRP